MSESDNNHLEEDRLDFEHGHVHGLIAFAMAVALTFRNKPEFLTLYEKAKLTLGAIAEQHTVSESFLEGMENVATRLTNVLKS